MAGGQMHAVDRLAPGFRARAIELHTKQGMQGSEILEIFEEEWGENIVAKSSFYRWWKEVLADHAVIEHSAKAAMAVVDLIKASGVDLDKNLELIAKQKAQSIVLGADPETEKMFLLKLMRETNRAKVIEIERQKWERERDRQDAERERELKRQLEANGLKKATVDDVLDRIRQVA